MFQTRDFAILSVQNLLEKHQEKHDMNAAKGLIKSQVMYNYSICQTMLILET